MAGFVSLPGAIDPAVALTPIQPEEVAFEGELWSDETALGIVLQDIATSEGYFQSKNLATRLEQADNLYIALVKPRNWPNTDKPRSNLGMPVVLEAVEKIIVALHMALWGSGKDPFLVQATGKTQPAAARAWQSILRWAVKQAGFKEESRRTMKTALLYGFTVGNWGWETKKKTIKTYKLKEDGSGEVESKPDTLYINCPTYECLDLRNLLCDPAANTQEVRKSGRFVIKRIPITAYDLDDLRSKPEYKNVPTREELAVILALKGEPTVDSLQASKQTTFRENQAERDTVATSADPLAQPLELVEYWCNERVVTVLQQKIVIRNEENEFGTLPFPSCAFIDVLGSAWGMGVARLLQGEQRVQQGTVNAWIDGMAMTLNPSFQEVKGAGPGTQNISLGPGKVITTNTELKPLVTPDVSGAAMTTIAASEDRAARRVGSNGGSAMPSPAMRTAEGVQAFTGDVVQRLQYWLEIYLETIFIPVLEAFMVMCKEHLNDPKQLQDILTEEEGKAYEGDILNLYNATTKFSIVGGTKLAAKMAAAQLIPMIMQLLQSAAVQDSFTTQKKKFNYAELFAQTLELMGLDYNTLIMDMTDEDMQRAMAMNQAAGKAQADMAVEQQKHENDLDSIDAKAAAQAQTAIVKQVVKSHIEQATEDLSTIGQ